MDLRNDVDQAIFATEKTLKETEGKGFDTERDAAQSALDELKAAQEANNLEDMKSKLEALKNRKRKGFNITGLLPNSGFIIRAYIHIILTLMSKIMK